MAPPSPSARSSVVWIRERPIIVEVPVPVVSPRTPPEEFAAKQLRLRDALGMRLTDIVDCFKEWDKDGSGRAPASTS